MASQAKKSKLQFGKSGLLTVILSIAILWLGICIIQQGGKISAEKAEEKVLNAQIEQQKEIEKTMNKAKSEDPKQVVEKNARSIGMVHENEIVIVDSSYGN